MFHRVYGTQTLKLLVIRYFCDSSIFCMNCNRRVTSTMYNIGIKILSLITPKMLNKKNTECVPENSDDACMYIVSMRKGTLIHYKGKLP